jgi:RNA polymerase sigma-70 factor, ECF subfamily
MLIRQNQGRVYSIALSYLGDREEARDLAQDIFVRVYRSLDSCRDADRFLPWLIRISRNAAVDQLRRRKARPPARDIPVEEAFYLVSKEPTPDQDLENESRRELVLRAMQELSDINREIIVLKDMQGLTLEEIAGMLGVPIGTIKSRSNRARLELARVIQTLIGPSGAEASA